jgi:hypothetical protein
MTREAVETSEHDNISAIRMETVRRRHTR